MDYIGYNQQTATTTELCLEESTTGAFCLEWFKTTEITYNWFNTVVLFALPVILFAVVRLFRRK